MSMRCLARGYHNDKDTLVCDGGRCPSPRGVPVLYLNEEGNLVDALRVLSHPGLPQVLGQGIYEYPHNPHQTLNFIYAPTFKVDSTPVRTIGSSLLVQQIQKPEDTIIHEIWQGGEGKLSALAEMARVFHAFWTTPLPIGQYVGWQPLDVMGDRFNVEILDVQIGGTDYNYREQPETFGQSAGSYISSTLTLKLKLAKQVKPPRAQLTMEGL